MVKSTFPIPFVRLKDYKKKKYNNKAFSGEVYNDFFIKVKDYFVPISHLPMLSPVKFLNYSSKQIRTFIRFVDKNYKKYTENKQYTLIDEVYYTDNTPKTETIRSITNYILKVPSEKDMQIIKALQLYNLLISPERQKLTRNFKTLASYLYCLVEEGYDLMPLPMKDAINITGLDLPKLEYFTLIIHKELPVDEYALCDHYNLTGSLLTPFILDVLPDKIKITTLGGLHWEFPRKPPKNNYEYLTLDKVDDKVLRHIYERQIRYGNTKEVDVFKVILDYKSNEYIFAMEYILPGKPLDYSSLDTNDIKILFLKVPKDKVKIIRKSYAGIPTILEIKGLETQFRAQSFPSITELPANKIIIV